MREMCVYFLFTLCFVHLIGSSLSTCPQLRANPNVVVICTNGQKYFKCDTENAKNQIRTGTRALYQCDRYYRPISGRLNGGRLNCTKKGSWTNSLTFKTFQCELDCGKQPALRTKLISHGNSTTSAKHWPWVATIFRKDKKGRYKYSCGGTLVGLRTVVTAAHCVSDERMGKIPTDDIKILIGTVTSNFTENLKENVQNRSVDSIFLHPDYHAQSLTSDIAIMQLADGITLNDLAQPICLPQGYEHDTLALSTGNFGEIASFGIDETENPAITLQYAKVPIVTNAKCNKDIRVIPRSDQFCAGDAKGPQICKGDSGSGLVFRSTEWNENKYALHGIVSSTGELYKSCSPLVVFTKVFSKIRWIQEIMIGIENGDGDLDRDNIDAQKEGTDESEEEDEEEAVDCSKDPILNKLKIGGSSKCKSAQIYNHAEKTALLWIHPLVKDILLEDYMHKDEYLIRFLRAKNLNVKETREMIQASMEWRKSINIPQIMREDFSKFKKQFKVLYDGIDKDGRPVTTIMGRVDYRKMVQTNEVDQFKRYIIRTSEEIDTKLRELGSTTNITQGVMIIDLHGIDVRHNLCLQCIQLWIQIVRIWENYYPNQFYKTYAINFPTVPNAILDSIRLLLSEVATTSLKMYGTNKAVWSKELLKQIPKDQLFRAYGGTRNINPRSMLA